MAYVLTLFLAAAIAALTLAPMPSGLPSMPGQDKIAHFMAFAVLAVPLAWRYPRKWAVLALMVAAYGGLIEIIQPYFGRSMEFADFLADGAGAFLGAWCASRIAGRWLLARTRARSKGAARTIPD